MRSRIDTILRKLVRSPSWFSRSKTAGMDARGRMLISRSVCISRLTQKCVNASFGIAFLSLKRGSRVILKAQSTTLKTSARWKVRSLTVSTVFWMSSLEGVHSWKCVKSFRGNPLESGQWGRILSHSSARWRGLWIGVGVWIWKFEWLWRQQLWKRLIWGLNRYILYVKGRFWLQKHSKNNICMFTWHRNPFNDSLNE